jgi:hypothetical protein
MMRRENMMHGVTARCPFCERLFIMPRPLFVVERERTACPACHAEAERNTREFALVGGSPSPASALEELEAGIKEQTC